METTSRISIKKALEKTEGLGQRLKNKQGTPELDSAMQELADKSKVSFDFLKMNLGIIKLWID